MRKWWEEVPTDLPLFVSIDKDVLCKQDASTTWSQGKMTLTQLLEGLEKILSYASLQTSLGDSSKAMLREAVSISVASIKQMIHLLAER